MGLWQTVVTILFVLLVMLQLSSVEAKKRKKGKNLLHREPTLQQLCRQASRSERNNILELKAHFDLNKAFACLRMGTCFGEPVCFVEDTPDLGRESLNNCTWNLLLQVLQTIRKIEPVLESPMNPPNNAKYRTDNSWDEAVSSLCVRASVYRMSGDTGEEKNTSNNGTSKQSSTTDIAQDTGGTNRSTTVPTNGRTRKRRQGGVFNRLIRKLLRSNRQKTANNPSCGVLDGCDRICIKQNEKSSNVPDCSTFKIRCLTKRLFRRSSKKHRKKEGKNRKKPTRSTRSDK